jgi:hypothetical protein
MKMVTTEAEEIHAGWYVFYTWRDEPALEVKMVRIAASCLGNAMTAAIEMASRSSIYLIGITPELGVREEPKGK